MRGLPGNPDFSQAQVMRMREVQSQKDDRLARFEIYKRGPQPSRIQPEAPLLLHEGAKQVLGWLCRKEGPHFKSKLPAFDNV